MQLDVLTAATAPEDSRPILGGITADLGFVPNLASVAAASPTLLAAFDALRRSVGDPAFPPVHREVAGLVVGVVVDNRYGVAFHSTVLGSLGMDEWEIDAMRAGDDPADPVLAAVARFARAVAVGRGDVGEDVVAAARAAGLADADLLQLVAECTFAGLVARSTGSPVASRWTRSCSPGSGRRADAGASLAGTATGGARMPEREADDVPTEDPRPDGLRRAPSLVLVNTGPGKGKTTAAMGVVVRAVARDWPVAVVQFLKSGNWKTGEEKTCRRLGVDWWAMGEGFTWDSADLTVDEAIAADAWRHARGLIQAGDHQLVVLDEVTYPINWAWIDVADVVATITGRPAHVNVVCTGRSAPAELIEVADTVTEMHAVKHAYDAGIRAKKGIDF